MSIMFKVSNFYYRYQAYNHRGYTRPVRSSTSDVHYLDLSTQLIYSRWGVEGSLLGCLPLCLGEMIWYFSGDLQMLLNNCVCLCFICNFLTYLQFLHVRYLHFDLLGQISSIIQIIPRSSYSSIYLDFTLKQKGYFVISFYCYLSDGQFSCSGCV